MIQRERHEYREGERETNGDNGERETERESILFPSVWQRAASCHTKTQ